MGYIIPQSFIDELINRIDIINIIEPLLPLKKCGHNYKTCCPFHEEKTPSFTVDHPSQTYHCFGCGRSGNVIIFLMEYEHINFIEAIQTLAVNAGMEMPPLLLTGCPTNAELETILKFDGDELGVEGSLLEIAKLLQAVTKEERTLGFIVELLHSQFNPTVRLKRR